MPLFIRKITRSKWPDEGKCQIEYCPADAITRCLGTGNNNTLSVWEVTSENDIDEAVLAMASAGDHLDAIDVIPMVPEYLKENGVDWEQSNGKTPVSDLRKNHRDLSNLTYKKIGIIACHVMDKITAEKWKRYRKSDLKEILNKAISDGRLEVDKLSNSIRKKLGFHYPENLYNEFKNKVSFEDADMTTKIYEWIENYVNRKLK